MSNPAGSKNFHDGLTPQRPSCSGAARLRQLSCGAVLLLCACASAPSVDTKLEKLEGIETAMEPHSIAVDPQWWRALGDPQLDRFVSAGLEKNPTLQQALARLRLVQAQADMAKAERMPQLSVDAEESYQRSSENDVVPPPYAGRRAWQESLRSSLSWSLDLWGRQAALIQQAGHAVGAARLDAEAARLALSTATVLAYIDLARAHARADLARRSEARRSDLVALTTARIRAGIAEPPALPRTEAAVAQSRGEIESSAAAVIIQRQELIALSGQAASASLRSIEPPALANPSFPDSSIPFDLLARRPDVGAARLRVEAATAGRVAARASFYPNVDLKAFVGRSATSFDFGTLFQSGSQVYGAGPAIHLPLFDGGALRSRYAAATSEVDLAIANYNQRVVDAVKECSILLTQWGSLERQIAAADVEVEKSQAALNIAQSRFAAGLADYLPVLDADLVNLNAQRHLVELHHDRLSVYARLSASLGGGIDVAGPIKLAGEF